MLVGLNDSSMIEIRFWAYRSIELIVNGFLKIRCPKISIFNHYAAYTAKNAQVVAS
jgi:hypothetical protein